MLLSTVMFNIKSTSVFLFVLVVLLTFSLIYSDKDKLSKINCESRINLSDINNNLSSNVYFTFSLDKNGGWLRVNGEIKKYKEKYKINRRLYFTYHRNENFFTLSVNKIILSSDDSPDSLLSVFLPLAYIKEGHQMDLFIYPQNNGGYLFSSSEHYSSYCQN